MYEHNTLEQCRYISIRLASPNQSLLLIITVSIYKFFYQASSIVVSHWSCSSSCYHPSILIVSTFSTIFSISHQIFSYNTTFSSKMVYFLFKRRMSRLSRIFRNDHRIMVFFIFTTFLTAVDGAAEYDKQAQMMSSLRLARIHRHLDKINKAPVLTIQSPDGDIIDCVHKRKQPALDHPLLKNHKIQRAPPELPKILKTQTTTSSTSSRISSNDEWQMWHKNGTRCPKGTVPLRRTTIHDVLRAKSLFHFGKKRHRFDTLNPNSRRGDAPDVVSGNGHEHAIAYTGSSEEVFGAKATINVWQPTIDEGNEFSLSQIWILSGSFDGSDLNSIEAGWQVSPELYGDNRPRLFTYWTSDSYQATGCYNLLCSGFIQTNSRIAIGAAISPVSSPSGNQYDITILIWKDPKLGNWWMSFGDSVLVGYWPTEIFTHLADRATMVEWGGEVVNSRANNGEHTTTQMGSGQFAEEGFGKASYFRNLEVVDTDNSLSSAKDISTLAENTNCYNIKSSSNAEWGTYFYYGGPGNNPSCP